MFDKLYQIVKENIGTDALQNANIPLESRESIVNEASGSIIDVLKSQIDNGNYNDLLAVFKVNHIEKNALVRTMISKYAIRLNKYGSVDIEKARNIASEVIPTIMRKFVLISKEGSYKDENGLFALFNKLSGYTINFETLFGKIPHTKLA